LSIPSYREWQGTTTYFGDEPSSGSVGQLYCTALTGTPCLGSNVGIFWLRSGVTDWPSNAWAVSGSSYSLHNGVDAPSLQSFSLVAWIQSSFCITGGSGTAASPHTIGDCAPPNTTPTITIANPAGNPWRSAVSGYTDITVSGSVTDPDTQTQAIQYSIDGGAWTAGQNLVAGTGTRSYSFSVNVGGLTEGNHTVKTRTYDGVAYSAETTTLSFRVDKTGPTCSTSGGSTTWTTSNVAITGTCSDTLSGCTGSNPTYTYTTETNITTAGPGPSGAAATVTDAVGNTGTCAANQTVRIDRTNPSFTLSPTPTGTSSYLTSTSLTISPSDNAGGSGVAETRYATTNALNSTCTAGGSVYSSAVTLSAGTNNIYVCVRDNAGNVSTNSSAHNEANVYQINKDPEIIPPIGTLSTLTQGEIIQIEPETGTFMCSDENCSGNGASAEPYKFMYTGMSDSTHSYFVMVDNYCAWRSAGCSNLDGTVSSWSGTPFNAASAAEDCTTGSTTGRCNDLGVSRKAQNILIQLDNFYNSLSDPIGGIAKDIAIPSKIFDMSAYPHVSGTGVISPGACGTTTNSNPFGNIQATFDGPTCSMTSKVSLLSRDEWLGGLFGWGYFPPIGTIGYAFCQARYGASGCDDTSGSDLNTGAVLPQYGFFNNLAFKLPFYPWLRNPRSGNAVNVFNVSASNAAFSVGVDSTLYLNGVLPSFYLQSSLPIYSGTGIYTDPYTLESSDPTLENSAPNIGAYASYASGFNSLVLAGTAMDEDIGQTLTIQYQIDGTAGVWSNLTTLVADGTNQNWSGTITLPVGLTDGTHTVYVRVYDGYGYSGNKTASFYLDDIPPSNTASLVGGVLCTGIPTIYCTAPTGITLTSSDATIGLDAYRTQWDTTFASGDVAPSWTSGTPPSSISTTSHTTSGQTHTLYYQTRDKLGNVSVVESISYYINHTPEISLSGTSHDQVVTPYTPLVLSGTFTDLDPTQTVTVKATINGIDYVSQTYPTTTGTVSWEIVIPFSSLQSLSPPQLTNLPLVVTDSAGVSSSTYYTGQITLSSSTSSEIYLSVIQNIPFSLTIGKVGAFNITFGTNQGITVAHNSSDEIIVSGSLSSPVSIPFGITTLVFTILDEPSTQVQQIEFV
ncbi:hypothetical protein FWH30_02920, partial [Microgenomates group bacterium]|nr:hypothetical protein [Microgenomates group bacterium]